MTGDGSPAGRTHYTTAECNFVCKQFSLASKDRTSMIPGEKASSPRVTRAMLMARCPLNSDTNASVPIGRDNSIEVACTTPYAAHTHFKKRSPICISSSIRADAAYEVQPYGCKATNKSEPIGGFSNTSNLYNIQHMKAHNLEGSCHTPVSSPFAIPSIHRRGAHNEIV